MGKAWKNAMHTCEYMGRYDNYILEENLKVSRWGASNCSYF
jgi:hypothetical protein